MQLIKGEKREIRIKITSTDNEDFKIRNAKWKLFKRRDRMEVENEGDAKIDSHEVSTLVQPEDIDNYILEFTFEIANEILKSQVDIEVQNYVKQY